MAMAKHQLVISKCERCAKADGMGATEEQSWSARQNDSEDTEAGIERETGKEKSQIVLDISLFSLTMTDSESGLSLFASVVFLCLPTRSSDCLFKSFDPDQR
jgi:hypothetical protein